MIKVLIVVSGLVLFVPGPGDDPTVLTALLASMPPHAAYLRQQIDRFHYSDWPIASGQFKATFRIDDGKQSINLSAQQFFPQLTALVAKPESKINPRCLNLECTEGKTGNETKLVTASVRFEGGWRTRPVKRCDRDWQKPVDFQETAQFEFRTIAHLDQSLQGQQQRPLATGLALEADISELERLHFLVDKSEQTHLQLTDPDTCRQWLGEGVKSCIVFEVENWDYTAPDKHCTQTTNPPPDCRVDKHFSRFYDLLSIKTMPSADDLWLPYAAAGDLACQSSVTHSPAVRCPPGWTEQ